MMKKLLLITLSFGIAATVSAQNLSWKYAPATVNKLKNNITAGDVNLSNSTIVSANKTKPKGINTSNLALSLIPLGRSTNAYGISAALNCVITEPASNTVVFGHRGSVSGSTTELDFSTDGGTTFTTNVLANPGATNNRYPSVSVENIGTATSANDVRYSIFTSANTGVLEGSWASAGLVTNIAGTASTGDFTTTKGYIPYSLFKGKNNEFWASNLDVYPDGADTVNAKLQHGVWDAALNRYVWSDRLFTTPNDYSFDSTSYLSLEGAIAFDPSGNIGFWAIAGDFIEGDANKVYNLALYKTTDGGVTWSAPMFCVLKDYPAFLNTIDPGLPAGTVPTLLSNESSLNIAVDVNGNPHISAVVFGSPGTSYAYNPGARKNLFDIYHNGSTFVPILIDSILSLHSGPVGSEIFISSTFKVQNYIRNQVARTADGTKLVFTWSETDVNVDAGKNTFPDLRMKGVNMSTFTVTPIINITAGSDADGVSYLANISPILLNTATGIEVPAVIASITGPDTGPLDHLYIKGITADLADFTILELRYSPQVGLNNIVNNLFTVSNNYPNPFSGSTEVQVSLNKPSSVSLKVVNTLGQVISEKVTNLSAATHTLAIDATELSTGVYFYTVSAGGFNVTNKMIVR